MALWRFSHASQCTRNNHTADTRVQLLGRTDAMPVAEQDDVIQTRRVDSPLLVRATGIARHHIHIHALRPRPGHSQRCAHEQQTHVEGLHAARVRARAVARASPCRSMRVLVCAGEIGTRSVHTMGGLQCIFENGGFMHNMSNPLKLVLCGTHPSVLPRRVRGVAHSADGLPTCLDRAARRSSG